MGRNANYIIVIGALQTLTATTSLATNVNRKIVAELDPIAPSSAIYEESANGVSTSKWGGQVDFNVAGSCSTGPEVWTGTFAARGPQDNTTEYRREDLWPGEKHKLDAIRLRWNIGLWEAGQSMRGWFVKGGYSYTRINSRANRYTESGGEGDALPAVPTGSPDDETDLLTDLRHGVDMAFGNRWLLFDQRVSVTVGVSFTQNFKRTVSVESRDPDARADYEDMIARLPDTRMHVRPIPEGNLGVGYAF